MIAAWRIASDSRDYTADDLTGAGAKVSGGRWNREGVAIVYAASSAALACLETVVHLAAGALPLNRYLVRIDIPDEVFAKRTLFDQLAPAPQRVGWDAEPPGRISLLLGEGWIASGASAILEVPSVIIPEERNILLNPAHPDAAAITATKLRRFTYDARLR
ncbi:RES family NAD+ phosphorylase [Aromatoleum evansii]|uniref:RES family NAD+ phosphorylase n=1 Tax=Aromatoleum evansii TaxID=59406 RepID=UPI00145E9DF0|nr:RES family NAD+ phosphorylase [Aromatoleum evansii]NMG29632.1 RES domain-containing protein [Aromatoleum evansii]